MLRLEDYPREALSWIDRIGNPNARDFARHYLRHLVESRNAGIMAPDARQFDLSNRVAANIRSYLTDVVGAAYPNPGNRGVCFYCQREVGIFPGPEHDPACPRYQEATRRRIKTIRANDPDDDPEGETEPEPDEEDYLIQDARSGGEAVSQSGSLLGVFKTRASAGRFIREDMARSGFFPNVWWVSDHGNAHLLRFRSPSRKQIAKFHRGSNKPTRAQGNPPRSRGREVSLYDSAHYGRGCTVYGRHAVDGQLYKHRFGSGRFKITGDPSGRSVTYTAKRGRLWDYF